MVRDGPSGRDRDRPAVMETGTGGIVRAVSNGDGADLPQSPVAESPAVSSDAIREYSFGRDVDLACYARGEPAARFLALFDSSELEDGSFGDCHRRGRASLVCARVPDDHLEFKALCPQVVTLRTAAFCYMRS